MPHYLSLFHYKMSTNTKSYNRGKRDISSHKNRNPYPYSDILHYSLSKVRLSYTIASGGTGAAGQVREGVLFVFQVFAATVAQHFSLVRE